MDLSPIAFTGRAFVELCLDPPNVYPLADTHRVVTRSVDDGVYDQHARTPQPIVSPTGERFLDEQLAQTQEDS